MWSSDSRPITPSFVHEDLEAHHNTGSAKFLEEPAREMQAELAETVRKALKAGRTMAQALLLAGLKLQAAAQRRAPILTGNLRASAFTRVEKT